METMSEKEDQLVLIEVIHRLLRRLESKNRGKDAGNLEHILANLESTDPDFTSYSIVRLLRSRIDAAIGPLVDLKLETLVFEGDGHEVVPQLMDDIMSSAEYTSLFDTLVTKLRAATDTILHGDEEEQVKTDGEPGSHGAQAHPHHPYSLSSCSSSGTQFLNLDESMSSRMSQFNHMGMLFMTFEQFSLIVGGIEQNGDKELRLESLRQLYQVPPSDTFNESWLRMRSALLSSLRDPCTEISILSLKILAKMLSSGTAQTAKEGYSILAEHLCAYYKSCDSFPVAMVTGVDLQDEECMVIAKCFRLANEFMFEVPNYWLRYGYSALEVIVSQAVLLLSQPSLSSPSTTPVVTPLHFMALLDSRARWFKKWMHSHYSRTEIVKHLKDRPKVLQECVKSIFGFQEFITSCVGQSPRRQETGSVHYSEEEITYAFFVHSLSMIERILLYKDSWRLFPVHVDGVKDPVSPTSLLVHLVHLTFTSHFHMDSHPLCALFNPLTLIAKLFMEIAQSRQCCERLMCVEEVVGALIQPLKAHMKQGMSPWRPNADTLMFVSDILAMIASQENGRHFLLYGPSGQTATINYSAPAHTIAQFTVCALQRSLTPPTPSAVTANFLFVCRQLYSTCEGLLVLKEYTLPKHIAAVWTQSSGTSLEEEAVTDNMLNFAATPKGTLLLHQTGYLLPCVVYMLGRYKMKLQVSKCEKFGYGCMVTQVASTAPGMRALLESGFVSMFVTTLWDIIDGEDDQRLVIPSSGPLDPTDRVRHKAVLNLLNVLSSFPAVYEAVSSQCVGSSEESQVSSVVDLLRTLVLLEGDERQPRLIHPEEAHQCGLRILSVLCSSLDVYLLLEASFKVTEMLLSLQEMSKTEKRFIIDAHSVLRNRILISTHCPGGPNERKLPPHTLVDDYQFTLFSTLPPPKEYFLSKKLKVKEPEDKGFSSFLKEKVPTSAKHAHKWLHSCQQHLVKALLSTSSIPNDLLSKLVQSCVKVLVLDGTWSVFPKLVPTSKNVMGSLQEREERILKLGSNLSVRYGTHLGLIPSGVASKHELQLYTLQVTVKRMLSSQQHKIDKSPLAYLHGDYPGFDWFVSTVQLLVGTGGEYDSFSFLTEFSQLLHSCYLWPQRMFKSVHLSLPVASSGIPPLFYLTAHTVEMVLEVEVPLVHSVFKMSGYTPSQICQHWLLQCFWSYLDWPNILLYIVLCLVMGIDYQVYICVAILQFMEKDILQHTQEQSLLVLLKEEPIRGFAVRDHLPLMQDLEKKYRHIIIEGMKSFASD
jgi:hypothetical protein